MNNKSTKKNELPFKISHAKKVQGIFCCAYGCTNKPIKKKGGLCHKHYARKLRHIDPVQVRYNQMRSKAKQRGLKVLFNLSKFRDWCEQKGYIVVKGCRGRNMTIDRIDNNQNYTIENIQLLTHRQNASKGQKSMQDWSNSPF